MKSSHVLKKEKYYEKDFWGDLKCIA